MPNTMQKQRKKPTTIILVSLCLLMVFSYVAVSIAVIQGNYKVSELDSVIIEHEREHNELRIELSRVSSLDHVLERSDELAYTEVQSVNYIQKPASSAVAAR